MGGGGRPSRPPLATPLEFALKWKSWNAYRNLNICAKLEAFLYTKEIVLKISCLIMAFSFSQTP